MSLVLANRWHVLTGSPAGHLCWLIDSSGKKAVMKRARDRSEKKLIEPFNEIVCTKFASILGTTGAPTHLERVEGEPVVLSVVESELNFSHVQSKNLTLSVANTQFMAALLVTDWWLANTDRAAGKNEHLVIIENEGGITPCPIDYSHTLNGCSGEVFNIGNVGDMNRIPVASYNHISGPYVQTFGDLQPTIRLVQQIQDSTIDGIINETTGMVASGRPEGEVSILRSNAEVVKALLKSRRDSLASSMKDWCKARGKE